MRWISVFLIAVVLGGLFFLSSPYVSLYRLARAVEARDLEEIERRVNFRAVRTSLARQVAAAYSETRDRKAGVKRAPGTGGGMGTTGLGAALAEPIVARIVTPEALIELIDRGAVKGIDPAPGAAGDRRFSVEGWEGLWDIVAGSEARGFRVMTFSAPRGAPSSERIRLIFRLQNYGWRLSGIELPQSIRRRLVEELPKDLG